MLLEENVENSLIQVDIFEIEGAVTKMPEGFVPDLYYKYNNLVIIGEAKTDKDLDREHSILQYKSYINYLRKCLKYGNECKIIIGVPWESSVAASRIIRRIINDEKIDLIIINESGVFRKYEKNSVKQ